MENGKLHATIPATWLIVLIALMGLLLLYIAVPVQVKLRETVLLVTQNKEYAREELAGEVRAIREGSNVLAIKINTNEQRWISIKESLDEIKQMVKDLK